MVIFWFQPYWGLENSSRIVSSTRGRPTIEISEEQLRVLLSFQFSSADIAGMFQVSARMIRRRILLFGLEEMANYNPLSDWELDAVTNDFVETHPNCGQRTMKGI